MTTALDIIKRATRIAGVYQKGEDPDSDEARDGLDALNTMLESWSTEKLFVYYVLEQSLTLVAGQGDYTMGPGGDLNTARPTFIDDSCRITFESLDYGLTKIDHDAWSAITAKTTVQSTLPEYVYPEMSYPLITLHFWPVPSQEATAVICSWKQLQSFAGLTTELALPGGYKRAIEFSLAEEFGVEFNVETPRDVQRIAAKARRNIKRLNAVTPIAVLETGYLGWGGGFACSGFAMGGGGPVTPGYQSPAFTAFAITGVSSPMEVGASFGPDVTFTWSTSNSSNVAANSIDIDDAGTDVVTGTANDGTQGVTLSGAVTRTTAGTHVFGIEGLNTQAIVFSSSLTLSWSWRLYYGVEASASLTEAEIEALASSSLASGYAGTYVMGAGGYKYICFAHAAGGQINSVTDASTGFAVPMAAGSFTDGGGFGYEKVSVTNAEGITTDVRVYRTFNSLGGAITLTVT